MHKDNAVNNMTKQKHQRKVPTVKQAWHSEGTKCLISDKNKHRWCCSRYNDKMNTRKKGANRKTSWCCSEKTQWKDDDVTKSLNGHNNSKKTRCHSKSNLRKEHRPVDKMTKQHNMEKVPKGRQTAAVVKKWQWTEQNDKINTTQQQ